MVSVVLVVAGFVGLIIGGNLLVQGAVEIAQRLRISPLVIGITLVGFGTSMPELVTSVQAALADAPGIALGNIIGSNIANILLILGIAALLMPIPVAGSTLRRDGGALVVATLAVMTIVLFGVLSRPASVALLAGLAVYMVIALRGAGPDDVDDLPPLSPNPAWASALRLIAGLALTIVAARILIIGATDIARLLDVNEAVIGLTVVAIGTSLPELVTSVVAALRRQSDMAVGNIIGSNIFNSVGILGVTGVLSPMAVPSSFASLDIWVMAGATLLLILFAHSGGRIIRTEGGILLVLYLVYTGVLITNA